MLRTFQGIADYVTDILPEITKESSSSWRCDSEVAVITTRGRALDEERYLPVPATACVSQDSVANRGKKHTGSDLQPRSWYRG